MNATAGWAAALCASLVLVNYLDFSESPNQGLGLDASLGAVAVVMLPGWWGASIIVAAKAVALVLRRREIDRRVLLALSGTAGTAALATILMLLLDHRGIGPALTTALVALLYLAVSTLLEVGLSQLSERRPFQAVLRATVRTHGLLLGAQLSVAMLTVIAWARIGAWSLALSIALLALVRQAYALLTETNETYDQTVRVIVEAVEGQSGEGVGHAERVAEISARIAERLALTPEDMQSVSITALLHDVGRNASLGLARGPRMTKSSTVTRESDHLRHAHPALEVLDGAPSESVGDRELVNAFIVAVASDVDDLIGGRTPDGLASAVSPLVSREQRGAVVGAAVSLGYPVPALSVGT